MRCLRVLYVFLNAEPLMVFKKSPQPFWLELVVCSLSFFLAVLAR
jgi:hypothetical protein